MTIYRCLCWARIPGMAVACPHVFDITVGDFSCAFVNDYFEIGTGSVEQKQTKKRGGLDGTVQFVRAA